MFASSQAYQLVTPKIIPIISVTSWEVGSNQYTWLTWSSPVLCASRSLRAANWPTKGNNSPTSGSERRKHRGVCVCSITMMMATMMIKRRMGMMILLLLMVMIMMVMVIINHWYHYDDVNDWWLTMIDDGWFTAPHGYTFHLQNPFFSVLKKVDVANFKDWNFHLRNNFPTEMLNKGNV